MREHNEPWKYGGTRCPIESPSGKRVEMHVITTSHPNGKWDSFYGASKKQIDHAVLCVNACEGMSDEDIEEAMKEFGNLNTVIKRMADVHDALESDLDKAIELLKEIYKDLLNIKQRESIYLKLTTLLSRTEARK